MTLLHNKYRWGVAALLALAIGATLTQGAEAHVWQSNQTGCFSVNSATGPAHNFWYSGNLTQQMRDATNYARQYSIDPTDINTGNAGSEASADVRVYDQDYSSWCVTNWHPNYVNNFAYYGWSQCITANSSGACTQHDVRYDESWTLDSATDVWERIALACHETGHTLGMEHWTNPSTTSCMYVSVEGFRNSFDGADVYWINLMYP